MMSSSAAAIGGDASSSSDIDGATSDDNRFSEFCRLCKKLEREPSYNAKTKLISDFLKNGSSGGNQPHLTPKPVFMRATYSSRNEAQF